MQHKDLICIKHLQLAELEEIWQLAGQIKDKQKRGIPYTPLQGKTLAMIFLKASTRTRISFEVGMYQLGGKGIYLNGNDIQLGRGETLADTARILSGYVDGILIRTFAQSDVEELARYAAIPVINGLTDLLHPCQIIADMFTIREKRGKLAGLKAAYIGDGNNVAHSWLYGAAVAGINLTVCTPKGYEPKAEIMVEASKMADNCRLELEHDPRKAAQDADVLYTDVWTSMGQEGEEGQRLTAFQGFQIDSALLNLAKPDALLMHCLPAHRGEEVSSEAIDGPHSIIFEQAQNRLPVQKAILALLLGKKYT
ncbi:MAG: ornithine carbamoyltransferase [Candidatus Schekmanbacteria bacterium]|nr:ornithine carbamoyltransferase [Candidatus Schekmanbacteria bacterium]